MNGIGNLGNALKRLNSGRTKRSIENDKPRANPSGNTGKAGNAGLAGNAKKAGKAIKKAIAAQLNQKSQSAGSFRNSFR